MNLQPAVNELILELKRDFPRDAFLALGQTVLWDEPMKAVWRMLLDQAYPEARLIAGVHDTDYFAKTTALVQDDSPYVVLPHDDGATSGLWSAAGEMSALFGSEDLPDRRAYERYGVPFHQLAREYPGDKAAFVREKTSAWGWRGIVETRSQQRIAHDVRLGEFLPALENQLDWAFEASLAGLSPENRPAAEEAAARMKQQIQRTAAELGEDGRLSELYEALLPQLYKMLLGKEPANFETTASTRLFQFNTRTCLLPRFRFVDLFLDPATAPNCREAYSRAVAGGGMYALDAFGEGALPFDIVAPGLGRGTLHVMPNRLTVDLPEGRSLIVDDAAIGSVADLAAALEKSLGPDIALVGKAVALISMIAGEFLIVFHETASGYSDRTTAMNDAIRASGIPLDLKPIVRVQYPTWDALKALGDGTSLELPQHLAQAFGKPRITAGQLARRWRAVVGNQRETLKTLHEIRTVRGLLQYLDETGDDSQCWSCHLKSYGQAQGVLAEHAGDLAHLKGYIAELKTERHKVRQSLDRLQRRKGDHFRRKIRPLQEQLAATVDSQPPAGIAALLAWRESSRERHMTQRLETLQALVKQMTRVLKQLRTELRRAERAEPAATARESARRYVLDAQLARLEHTRSAILTSASLPHIQARPSAWWLPLVDPSGAWFNAIAEGTTARLERV